MRFLSRGLFCLALLAAVSGGFAQKLTILTEQNLPNSGLGPDGKLTGFGVEIVQEIQGIVGNRDAIQIVPWARGLADAAKGPNVLLFCTTRNAQRDPLYQWVGPILEPGYAFYGLEGAAYQVKSLEEAKKAPSIGVVREDARDQFLTAAGFTNLDRVADYTANYKKLMAGRISLVAASQATAEPQFIEAGGKPGQLKQQLVFFRSQLWIAFSKDVDKSVTAAWQGALDTLKKNGRFEAIHRKYYPALPLPGPPITSF